MKNFLFGLFIICLIAGIAGCGGSDDSPATTARIVVTNNTDFAAEIHMDGALVLDLDRRGASGTINNVTTGTHSLIAYVSGTDTVINTTSITAAVGETYYWIVEVIS